LPPSPRKVWKDPLVTPWKKFTNFILSEIHANDVEAGPDLPTGYIGLSLGPQDPRGPPTNCGTHRVTGR